MFNNVFSFNGRIRRLEYGLSLILYVVLYACLVVVWEAFNRGAFIFYLISVVLLWFLLAQGSKRCHDIGYSAFYQFIPFYFLILIFQDGQSARNAYGKNPKDTPPASTLPTLKRLKERRSFKHSRTRLLILMSSSIMSYVLISVVLLEYLPFDELLKFAVIWLLVVPFFLLALLAVYRRRPLNLSSYLILKQRFLFGTCFYIGLRLYVLFFRETAFEPYSVPLELLFILLLAGISWGSYKIYLSMFNKTQVHA
ncbi:DUF805 domain-containing protein [Robertkochia flava]|uniref:DUF805 domain-containing protein n=1 Tax=Robertkochia flava TaxID=3447986 RepID=UPI001CC9D930|nr:DUF805 domain-containing protein [Robertkochia marina]